MEPQLSDAVDEVLGADYESGGRGPAYDCMGLALRLGERVWGRRLPDPRFESPHALRAALAPVEGDPEPGDWLYTPKGGGHDQPHFAVVESTRWAVEAHRQFGVRRRRLSDALAGATVWRAATS